jgi:hypothetical protein
VLEKVMRHFYLRGLIEESMGIETDWKAADSAFVQAAAIATEGGLTVGSRTIEHDWGSGA